MLLAKTSLGVVIVAMFATRLKAIVLPALSLLELGLKVVRDPVHATGLLASLQVVLLGIWHLLRTIALHTEVAITRFVELVLINP